jgi:DNA-binding MarR family transcriptional regulator
MPKKHISEQPLVNTSNTSLRLSYLIARTERVVNERMGECLRPHGLNVPQYTALSILGRRSGLSNAQLARRTYISPQGMKQVLDQLIESGLVARKRSQAHGRVLEVALTTKGKRLLAACDVAVDAMEANMLQSLSAGERKELMHALLSCVHALHGGLESVKELEL